MASDKNRPTEKDSLTTPHEQTTIPQEQELATNQSKFSTHPPPDRTMISGSFRLTSAENLVNTEKVYALFEKLPHYERDIVNPTIGGILLKEFDLFNRLPYRIRDFLQESLLTYFREKSIYFQNEKGEKRHQLPLPPQVNLEIVRQVFEKNQIQVIKDEVTELLKYNHSDDRQRAEEIVEAMIQWLEHYEVQLYAHGAGINIAVIGTELRGLLFRLRTRKIMNTVPSDPLSPPLEPPRSSKKEEKDRS